MHLKQLRCHTFPRAIITKVSVTETLVSTKAAVEDCPDVRDIALNHASVSPLSECAEDERLSVGVRSLPRL